MSRVLFSFASPPKPRTTVLSLQKYWWLWYLLLLGFSLQTHIPRSDFIYAVLHNSLHDLQTAYDKHSEGVRHFKVWVWDFSMCSQNQCLRCSTLSKYKLYACFADLKTKSWINSRNNFIFLPFHAQEDAFWFNTTLRLLFGMECELHELNCERHKKWIKILSWMWICACCFDSKNYYSSWGS